MTDNEKINFWFELLKDWRVDAEGIPDITIDEMIEALREFEKTREQVSE